VGRAVARAFRGRGSDRRKTAWSAFDSSGYQTVASGGATLLSGIAFEAPGTIVRTRGQISVKPGSFGADLDVLGAFGIGLVSGEAFAAGVASIPEPFSDADWGGWMVIQPFAFHFESITQAGVLLGSFEFEIDSKGMRKVEPNSVMVAVAESVVGSYQLADVTRLLLMLH